VLRLNQNLKERKSCHIAKVRKRDCPLCAKIGSECPARVAPPIDFFYLWPRLLNERDAV